MNTLFVILVVVVAWETAVAWHRKIRRRQTYLEARKRSLATGKPLVVVGDPDNGAVNSLTGRDYGEGDVTVDITGCPGCENGVRSRIEDFLPTLGDDSCVLFVCCVLEYVEGGREKMERILRHATRVSGGDRFLVTVEPYCLSAWFYFGRFLTGEGGAKRVFTSASRWIETESPASEKQM